jgi:hypothetical protein
MPMVLIGWLRVSNERLKGRFYRPAWLQLFESLVIFKI